MNNRATQYVIHINLLMPLGLYASALSTYSDVLIALFGSIILVDGNYQHCYEINIKITKRN